tara:strand:- start:27 stop:638 length:612 start_codon:yes stop_codon:yes gene_type:complete
MALITTKAATATTVTSLTSTALPVGTYLQSVNWSSGNTSYLGNASVYKLMDVTLTTKGTNSHFLIETCVVMGSPGLDLNNDSYDISLAIGYKLTSAADSAIVSRGGRSSFTRQNFAGTSIGTGGAFYQTDVPYAPNRTDTHGGAYDVLEHATSHLDTSLSLAIGTQIDYSIWIHGQSNWFFNRCRQGASNGGTSFLKVTEIQT